MKPNSRDWREAQACKAPVRKLAERRLAPAAPLAYAGIIATPHPSAMQGRQLVPPETLARLPPDAPRVDLLRRTEAGWEQLRIAGAHATLALDAVGPALPMAQLYA